MTTFTTGWPSEMLYTRTQTVITRLCSTSTQCHWSRPKLQLLELWGYSTKCDRPIRHRCLFFSALLVSRKDDPPRRSLDWELNCRRLVWRRRCERPASGHMSPAAAQSWPSVRGDPTRVGERLVNETRSLMRMRLVQQAAPAAAAAQLRSVKPIMDSFACWRRRIRRRL